MSHKLPSIIANRVSERARKTLDVVAKFVEEECIPADAIVEAQTGQGDERWNAHPPIIEELKRKAQALGLWNLFLLQSMDYEAASPGFSVVEYGLMAEWLGRSLIASEATNCSAPDTGNMEVLAKYGSAAQKARWLAPLLRGEIRSAFLMTEPDVASSDARNMGLRVWRDGNDWVLDGEKWWSSGAGDPRCEVFIVMGRNVKGPDDHGSAAAPVVGADLYKSHSVFVVPASSPGITIQRMLSVYGYDDAPHGHGQVVLSQVRVPGDAIVLGPGRGFEIIQGRLGPGRIHHAMRTIGAAERALDWMVARAADPRKRAFGQATLSAHGVVNEWLARSRIDIDAARLVVLNAACAIDDAGGAKRALREIACAKVLVPNAALAVIDRAIQLHGGEGVSQLTPLARFWANIRTLRLADGPDEVHLAQLGRFEARRGPEVAQRIEEQKRKRKALAEKAGVEERELGGRIKEDRNMVRSKSKL